MRSESTSALEQPSETNPILRAAAGMERMPGIGSGFALGRRVLVGPCFRFAGAVARERRVRVHEVGELEGAEDVSRLFLQLLLHLEEGLRALVEVARHQALDRRALHLDELAPGFGAEHRVVAQLAE